MSPTCPVPPSAHTMRLVPLCGSGWLVNNIYARWRLSLRSSLQAKRYLCFGRHCRVALYRPKNFSDSRIQCSVKFCIYIISVWLWQIRTDQLKSYAWNWQVVTLWITVNVKLTSKFVSGTCLRSSLILTSYAPTCIPIDLSPVLSNNMLRWMWQVKGKPIPVQSRTALRPPGDWGYQNFQTFGTWRCYGCQPYEPAAFTVWRYPWYSFMSKGWVDPRAMEWPEGLSRWKIPMEPLGIEPAIFSACSAVPQFHIW
jgi:hypothetical protein